jgi:hypothetical protein
VEQNRRPRYDSTQQGPPNSWQRHQKHMMEKLLQRMLLGKLGICLQNAETRSMSFTLCNYQLKVD